MDELSNKYLLFEVDEEYALNLSSVLEIIELKTITRVPEAPDYVSGIINLRGNVVPILDIRKRFRKPERPDVKPRCVIICNVADNRLGLMVDNVIDLINIDPSKLKDPPQLGSNYVHVFIKNIGISGDDEKQDTKLPMLKMHLIVDTDKLINYNDLHFFDDDRQEELKMSEKSLILE